MSVAISDVRFQVQDQARNFGVSPESPRYVGTADGTTTTFYLPLDRWQYVAGSAVLYAMTPSGTPPGSGIATTQYTISQSGQIVFTTAPGATGSPIVNGSILSAQFQGTVFADADLANILADNVGKYGDSASIKKGCQLDIINILLMNVELLSLLRGGEYSQNPAYVVQQYVKLKEGLMTELEGGPRPGKAIPSLLFNGVRAGSYQPRR